MRFRAPRSVSPSPERGYRRHRSTSTFGLQSDSDSEDYDSGLEPSFNVDSDEEDARSSASSASSSSLHLVSDINKLSIRPRHISRTPHEEKQIEEAVASIRLRTRHNDPYEDWEKQTRLDALKTARREYPSHLKENLAKSEKEMLQDRINRSGIHIATVTQSLEKFRVQMQPGDNAILEKWQQRTTQLWENIEAALKLESEIVAKRLAEEQKMRDELERKRKEAEEKKRQEEEKRKREEEAKQKEEEEKRKAEEEKKREEALEREQWAKAEDEKNKRLAGEAELRKTMSFNPAQDDWKFARTTLYELKSGPVKQIKDTQNRIRGEFRRKITPKIGQLTNDAQSVRKISNELLELVMSTKTPSANPALYPTICNVLAKAIILQAETEVTAEKRSAEPLAQVTFVLLERLEHFPSIFWCKVVQRCGGWPIAILVPPVDVDGLPWNSPKDRAKASGVRQSATSDGPESTEEYVTRVAAIMRVYFHILKIRPGTQPLDRHFQMSRYWTWFARIMSDTRLLADPAAPQLLYTGLEVMGLDAVAIFGQQWIKMLNLIYKGVTVGWEEGKLIGGNSPFGAAARTRVILALEDIYDPQRHPQPRSNAVSYQPQSSYF